MAVMTFDHLDRVAAEAFDGYIVRKDLVRKFARQYPVPTYVCEFLLGRYCASTDEDEIQEGLHIVERQLRVIEVLSARSPRADHLFGDFTRGGGPFKLTGGDSFLNERRYVVLISGLRICDRCRHADPPTSTQIDVMELLWDRISDQEFKRLAMLICQRNALVESMTADLESEPPFFVCQARRWGIPNELVPVEILTG